MANWVELGPAVLGGAVAAGTAVYMVGRGRVRRAVAAAEAAGARRADAERERILADAHQRAALAAREELVQAREGLEEEIGRRRGELERREAALERRLAELEERGTRLERGEQSVAARAQGLETREQALGERERESRERLERVAGLTAEEARREVLRTVGDQAKAEAAALQRDIKEQARKEADREARRIVAIAIQRIAAEQTAESTVAAVALPSDELKGRIIGREGRNIRAFEAATGVDVIIDDTPDTVVVSCFDPVRRETARLALERLIADGRIHPGRIEEVVTKAREEIEAGLVEAGEQAAYEVGIHGLHPELIKLVGRMKYRTSYGQNILHHSKEVAWLAGMMAAELKLDVQIAKRGGLLHDIGKVLTHEHEGTHVQLGVEMATKYGEHALVVNCIAAHHDDVPHESPMSVIVQAADAVSGARPGARREAFETYVKRLSQLEELAAGYQGVERVYAIQAGREVRVVVAPGAVDDARAAELSEQIARKIEQELQYPGQIRVVVIRETRAVGFAR
jgi:ribonuclease Y